MSRWHWDDAEVEDLLGKTLVKVKQYGEDELFLETTEGDQYLMYHDQDCCENVYIEDIIGDLSDLIGNPLLMSESVSEDGDSDWGSSTWTFYKFATIKGDVTLRWLGESNGYYSESVSLVKVPEDEKY
ncbi:DUF7448 domain-containing protein [Bacillus altitudinis]|uniref:DUF7448 domain-containing protein n=1 Tax=Bacillus altitudinis TaxID=293387 RepID=UPI0021017A35|nr:hypothetical protein [Bacillus altitudinis]UTV34894.1 hypothetical protein NM966_19610 [Bacillus altitudinis]